MKLQRRLERTRKHIVHGKGKIDNLYRKDLSGNNTRNLTSLSSRANYHTIVQPFAYLDVHYNKKQIKFVNSTLIRQHGL